MSSVKKAESLDKGKNCTSLGGKAAEAVKQTLGGRASEVDEVCPEFIK